MRESYRGAFYLSAAASIWGGMYVASKYAMASIPPFTLLFVRYVLAAIFLVAWCRYAKVDIVPRKNKFTMFQIGFLGYFLSVGCQFIGTSLSSAHMGSAITTLSPIFQSIFAVIILKEAATVRQTAAIVLSFIGVVIITDTVDIIRTSSLNIGNLFLLAAAALWGYYSVLSKKVSSEHPILQITTWGIIVAAVFAFPAALLELGSWDPSVFGNGAVLFSIFYIVLISTVTAFYCWNKGLALLNSHQAGLFMFLQAVVGSVLGYLLLGEHLSLSFITGTVFILSAVYLSISR